MELEAFAEDFRDPVPETRGHVETGSPAPAIIDFAADHEVDLVAISTHGRASVQEAT